MRRKKYVYYVVVVAFAATSGNAKNPYHTGPFYDKQSAVDYRNKWDNQFKGFAVVDKRPITEPVADVLALNWKQG